MNNEILRLSKVIKNYSEKTEKLEILKEVDLVVNKGEFISILGRSGSGKSSLLNVMGLLDKIDGGAIFIDGKEVATLEEKEKNSIKNKMIGFVFQFHYLLPEFTALENVMLPAMLDKKCNIKKIEEEAKELLALVGLKERISHKPYQLSGGEKQRVAIARAMINRPQLILADEPTGNLDEETSEIIFNIFKDINEKYKQTIVVVTHSKELAKITDTQYFLKRGKLEKNNF